jgi:hypothetical protein
MLEEVLKSVLPILFFFVGAVLALGVSLMMEKYRK